MQQGLQVGALEQKRKDGDRPDRVKGLIESFLQSRARSLDIGR